VPSQKDKLAYLSNEQSLLWRLKVAWNKRIKNQSRVHRYKATGILIAFKEDALDIFTYFLDSSVYVIINTIKVLPLLLL
jgi:hypothetical protein